MLFPCQILYFCYFVITKSNQGQLRYRKIPKISPGAYMFQRPFLRGLVFEGLIFGGAYICTEGNLRFKIDWASL